MIVNADSLEFLKTLEENSIHSIVTDPPYELGFMKKKWDSTGIAYRVDFWKECLRVLKPGGYLLAFGGSRTYHRMTVAIEDAGFEIRDQIMWIYGEGFPKSLNIGKAYDEFVGNERELVGEKNNTYDGYVRKPENHKSPAESSNIGEWGLNKTPHGLIETRGNSEWEGWGTALKPGHEPICMARKPPSERTVVENVVRWGTGGINIDGCRIEIDKDLEDDPRIDGGIKMSQSNSTWVLANKSDNFTTVYKKNGRFPSNVIHDGSDEVLDNFQCSASRFFYCAKPGKSERNKGLEGLKLKYVSHDGRNKHIENPYQRHNNLQYNHHPTVKPIKLIRYLVRLVTPKNGVVLDPFMGSGTTGIACKLEGFDFLGIEKEVEYYEIASLRIENCKNELMEVQHPSLFDNL